MASGSCERRREAVFGGTTVGTNVGRNGVEYVGSGTAIGTIVSLRGQLNVASGGVATAPAR